MEKAIFNHIEKMLRDYPKIDSYIRQRENEIMYPYKPDRDENIGGGRALNKRDESTELAAITIADDKYIQGLKRNKEIISRCLKQSDSLTYEIMEQLYFKEFPFLTMTGIAQFNHVDRTVCSRRRTQLFEKIAEELGWV